jgi:hypothetical protein
MRLSLPVIQLWWLGRVVHLRLLLLHTLVRDERLRVGVRMDSSWIGYTLLLCLTTASYDQACDKQESGNIVNKHSNVSGKLMSLRCECKCGRPGFRHRTYSDDDEKLRDKVNDQTHGYKLYGQCCDT